VRVGLDASPLAAPGTAPAVYVECLARALAALRPDDQFLLLADRPVALEDRRFPRNLELRVTGPSARPGALRSIAGLPQAAARLGLDLFHASQPGAGPAPVGCPVVLTVHDLAAVHAPGAFPHAARWLALLWQPVGVHRARAVLVPSRRTAEDLRHVYGLPADRIAVVPLAAGPEYSAPLDAAALAQTRRRLGLPHPFILGVGAWEPRKNREGLIEAFERALRGKGLPHALVLAGPGRAAGSLPAPGGRVRTLGLVPRFDMPALYRLADFLACPSHWEGFGLSVLEAMASGTPVLAPLDRAVAETAGEALFAVDAADPDALAEGLLRLASDGALKADLRRKGLARSAGFSWEETARRTWQVYERATARPAAALY